ncbi:MAG: glycosyltransferase family 2 protein [Eubacteriales bacterium]
MELSIVVPCYNEAQNVRAFYDCLMGEIQGVAHAVEVIFVNDGSQDGTSQELSRLYEEHQGCVKVIEFSRNFGKEAALIAGLMESKGEYVSIIDADLQQNPKYLSQMITYLDEHPDYDAVAAYQSKRKESKVLSFYKSCFYRLINRITDIDIVYAASDFRTLRRCVVDAIIDLPERCRFSKGIFAWVGFPTYYMPYEVEDRAAGTTKWNFLKLMSYAVDGIVAFSSTPLMMSSIMGFLFCAIAFLVMILTIIKTIFWGEPVAGYPTIVTTVLFVGGTQLFSLGILGQYMAKTYVETKQRPIYIIKNKMGSEDGIEEQRGVTHE